MRVICAVLVLAVAGPVAAAMAGGGVAAPQSAPAAPTAGGGVAAPPPTAAPPAPSAPPAPAPSEAPSSPPSTGGVVAPAPAPVTEAPNPQVPLSGEHPKPSAPGSAKGDTDPSVAGIALSPATLAAATPLAPMASLAQDEGRRRDRPGVDIEVPVPEDDPVEVEPFPAEAPGALPSTGMDTSAPATGGIAMLAAGLALLALTRRRLLA